MVTKKLPGDYISGFVDGEGCFALKFRRDVRHDRKNTPVYFYWDIEFVIALRGDDKKILEAIQDTLGCGKISTDKKGQVRYAVNDIHDLSNKIVPFFSKYKLRAKKQYDFNLWKAALMIFIKNQNNRTRLYKITHGTNHKPYRSNWNPNDFVQLKAIYHSMTDYKSARKPWKWL